MNTRSLPLNKEQQKAFVSSHLPGRIAMIRANRERTDYSAMAAVAIAARALASFFGIGRSKATGRLYKEDRYFEHSDGESFEVKISDIEGGRLVDPGKLPASVQHTISEGILETNVAFAHITFWPSPADQEFDGKASPDYLVRQYERIRDFGDAVVCLWEIKQKELKI